MLIKPTPYLLKFSLLFISIIALNITIKADLISGEDSIGIHFIYHDLYSMDSDDLSTTQLELNKALMFNPDDVRLNINRAKLQIFMKDYSPAIGLLKRLNKIFPGNAEVIYHLARGYALKGELQEASGYLTLLNTKTKIKQDFHKELELDVLPFMLGDEKDRYEEEKNKFSAIIKFIRKKDLSPASAENEFFLEMINRIDYAYNEFYSGEFLDDRGQMYIKYGKPSSRSEFVHQGFKSECWVYYNLDREEIVFDFIWKMKRPLWILISNQMEIKDRNNDRFLPAKGEANFDDSKASQTFFEDRSQISNSYAEAYLELLEILTSEKANQTERNNTHTPPKAIFRINEDRIVSQHITSEKVKQNKLPEVIINPDIPTIQLACNVCRFKNKDNGIRLETSVGFPIGLVEKVLDAHVSYNLELETSVLLKDYSLKPIHNLKNKVHFEFQDPYSANFIDLVELVLPDEEFYLALEVRDNENTFLVTNEFPTKTNEFLKEDIFTSDLQFSNSINTEDDSSKLYYKNGLVIQPYPYTKFSTLNPFFLYFELYNLSKKHSITDYTITYTISELDDNGILSGEPESVTFEQTYTGNKKDDYHYFEISTNELDDEKYQLSVKVKDNYTEKEFERIKQFEIID